MMASDYVQLPDSRRKLQDPTVIEPVTCSFDGPDVAYLSANFDTQQLRNELKRAQIEQGVARCWAEDDALTYWTEYADLCRKALEAHRAAQPKPPMGRFSVKAVKEGSDIVDVIGRYTPLRKSGKEYMGKCPFHDDRQPSLSVNEEKQLWYCFSCGRKGDVVNFVMQIENADTKGACRLLAGQ